MLHPLVPIATSLLMATSFSANADTLSVCQDGCDFDSIQAAIDAAAEGDTIELQAEVYSLTSHLVTGGKNLTITGVSGSVIDASGIKGTQTYGGVLHHAGAGVLTLRRLVVAGGRAGYGGGIAASAGHLEVIDCTLRANTATSSYGGGAIYLTADASATITGTSILENRAYWIGGAVMGYFCGDVSISDCDISENQSLDGPTLWFRQDPGRSVNIAASRFRDNLAVDGELARHYDNQGFVQDCLACGNVTVYTPGANQISETPGFSGFQTADVTIESKCLQSDCIGDLNGDGEVSGADLGLLLLHFGAACP